MLVGREDGEYHDKIGSIESMWKWKQEPDRKKLILSVMSVQVVLLVIYSMIVIAGYSSYQPLVFSENDMQLYTTGGDVETGNYTDTSFEEVKAVVTPAISLKKGVYADKDRLKAACFTISRETGRNCSTTMSFV